MIQFIFQLLCFIVYFYLVISSVYLLVFAIAGRCATSIRFELTAAKKRIIVLIPAYKEDAVIVETAQEAAAHDYPFSYFKVMVIADSLQQDTIEKLHHINVTVLEVAFENSTKARSLHAVLAAVKNDDFEIAVVLDADNVMEQGCLEQINSAFHKGYKAIQCHRSAKNQDSPIARLNDISEEININLFRRGPSALGLSAMPLGSGMAFEFNLLKEIFDNPDILDNPAEDRDIEMELMKRKLSMIFLDRVYVYDEKVSEASVFQRQRIRWLEAQLNQIRRFFKSDLSGVSKTGGYHQIFFQSLLLPRLLYLLVCCVIIFVLIFQKLFNITLVYPASIYWLGWVALYFLVMIISIPRIYYSLKTLRDITYIPLLMIAMLKALFKLKRNRKEFLHTSKKYKTR